MLYKDYFDAGSVVFDADAINQAIENILLTRRGSVPGKPEFGSDIHRHLFSQLDHITKSLLKTDILTAINEWEPRVYISNVEVKEIPEYNKIVADITYEYADKGLIVEDTALVTFNI